MMFKAAVAAFISLAVLTAGLYWQNSRVTAKNVQLEAQLEAAEIRAENAIADLSLAHAALKAQAAHTARIEALARELAAIERDIPNMEGHDAPLDDSTIAFLRSIGLLDF